MGKKNVFFCESPRSRTSSPPLSSDEIEQFFNRDDSRLQGIGRSSRSKRKLVERKSGHGSSERPVTSRVKFRIPVRTVSSVLPPRRSRREYSRAEPRCAIVERTWLIAASRNCYSTERKEREEGVSQQTKPFLPPLLLYPPSVIEGSRCIDNRFKKQRKGTREIKSLKARKGSKKSWLFRKRTFR